jgi:hypothetical protein
MIIGGHFAKVERISPSPMADPRCEDDLALFDDTATEEALQSQPHADDPGSRTDQLLEDAKELLHRRAAENTRKTYAKGWRDFTDFCKEIGRPPLPAAVETVAMYISDRYGKHAPNTIESRLSAIQFVHDQVGKRSPTRSRKIEELIVLG